MACYPADNRSPTEFVMPKILVIEDSPEVRERIVTSLTFEGFNVVEAGDGEAGVRMAHEAMPDLIICDIMMPKLDGHATLSALREDASTASIPFIFSVQKARPAICAKACSLARTII